MPRMLARTTTKLFRTLTTLVVATTVGFFGACSSSEDGTVGNGNEPTNLDGDAPLSSLDELIGGAPSNDQLPPEGKADAVYPSQFFDLVAKQSPVKSQGSRGVCSIFATTALMEHLYITEGTFTKPDFSEQFLQWSVKTEARRFTDTEGSNSQYNLEAINRFGIVEEQDWKYESMPWGTSKDPACTGEDRPTRCYTNGDPPASALAAQRWHLPPGRWINSSARSIKAHMYTKRQAVVVGSAFYYQAWNHRGSTLKINNDYWRKGYVTYPNDRDKTESEKNRAGHGYLLVGWDDELQVQSRDGDGNLMVDASGNPVMEKGFFIFKNSWGTGSFGVNNPHGDGYGYISMRYVEQYASAYVSDLPDVKPPAEVCNDGIDNDRDKAADCDDSDCTDDPACVGETGKYFNNVAAPIPDNDPEGVRSSINVPEGGSITAMAVSVDITHSYRGDLIVKLVREGGKEVVLQSKQGGSEDNLKTTFTVPDFNGEDAAGTWTLVVIDTARQDTGKLNSWSLDITRCSGDECGGQTFKYDSAESRAIPDGDPSGVFTNIEVTDAGKILALKVHVDITHPEQIDLSIKLQRLGMPGEVVLQKAATAEGEYVARGYPVTAFNGQDAAGTWRLTVTDEATGDAGTLNGWSLEITR